MTLFFGCVVSENSLEISWENKNYTELALSRRSQGLIISCIEKKRFVSNLSTRNLTFPFVISINNSRFREHYRSYEFYTLLSYFGVHGQTLACHIVLSSVLNRGNLYIVEICLKNQLFNMLNRRPTISRFCPVSEKL